MKLPEQYRETFDFYVKKGFAARVGFGERPALLVIDMIRAFTDLRSPLASNLDSQMDAIGVLLESAREQEIPIIFSTVAYDAELHAAKGAGKATPGCPGGELGD